MATSHPPYSVFDSVYEQAMGDIPHAAWFRFVTKHLPPSAGLLADLFCGPGYMAAAARAAGLNAIAVDSHLPFLRTSPQGICARAEDLPFAASVFAALTATNAAVNYLADTETLSRHLAECCRVLSENGIYVFDVCPQGRALRLATRTYEALDGKVRFAHRYASDLRTLTTTVSIADGPIAEEQHVQRIFEPGEISAAAEAAGLVTELATPNYGLPVSGDNVPIMTYVLRKPVKAGPTK